MKKTQRVLLTLIAAAMFHQAYGQTDVTDKYLTNPGFENGSTGWVINGMQTQTNPYFTAKTGNTYLEAWVERGKQLGSASGRQTVTGMTEGKYRLIATAMNVQQAAAESTENAGDPQTGVSLVAGDYSVGVNAMKDYTLDFAVLGDNAAVTIGFVADGATGNWIATDNYRLYYLGAVDAEALAGAIAIQKTKAESYLALGVRNDVRTAVEAALQAAEAAVAANPLVEVDLRSAYDGLVAANALAAESRVAYDRLASAIAYGRNVYGWWKDLASKAEGCRKLDEALKEAEGSASDYTLTDAGIDAAIARLNVAVAAVDKKIYESYWAVGTGDVLHDPDNEWCYDRSMQSKHWILYWDKGYGNETPGGLEQILRTADETFELYAGKLGFITINEGVSKTDEYKMIIRLKSTTEWEATGSGIDDTIGMLNLSRWAYTSRGGQTLAHEIGHCFQYQVHCDKGDRSGWMYEWTGSPNGNVFWEMCAQWQAYKYYPEMQFNNEWLDNTLNGLHQNPFHEELRYNNYFIQDYLCHKHGIDFIGRLWNETKSPEDPFQTYMRMSMEGNTSQKVALLGDEMWEYGARMTTFDFYHLEGRGDNTIGRRKQTSMTAVDGDYFLVNVSDCVENFGHNAIKLKVPEAGTIVAADFAGLADTTGYRGYRTNSAGWRAGFVSYNKDGSRTYGDMIRANGSDPNHRVLFTVPADCKNLWFVVSGAPTKYWTRGWDGNTDNDEQWPYKVRFRNTNLIGKKVVTEDIAGIESVAAEPVEVPADIYSISGVRVRKAGEGTEGLAPGVYISGGKKLLVR